MRRQVVYNHLQSRLVAVTRPQVLLLLLLYYYYHEPCHRDHGLVTVTRPGGEASRDSDAGAGTRGTS